MKKLNLFLASITLLLATLASAQQTNLMPIILTGTTTNITSSSAYISIYGAGITNQPYTQSNPMYLTIGDTIPVAFAKVNSNEQFLASEIAANTNTVTAINFSNLVLSSQQFVLWNTNPIVFNGSNFIGTFPMLYSYNLTVPQISSGPMDPGTPLNEAVMFSTNGGASWYSNTLAFPNLTNSVMVAIVGASNSAPGALQILGVDHPELLGRTNAMYGQTFAFGSPVMGSDPVTLSYLQGYPSAGLAASVVMFNGWTLNSTNLSGTNHVYFTGYGMNAIDLASAVSFIKIDSIALDATKTNIVLQIAVSNYVAGAFVETTTNLAGTFLSWIPTTPSGSVTNSGEISFTNHITTASGVQFWRARGNASTTLSSGPVIIKSSGLTQPFYTPTNSSDVTLGNVLGLIRWDTTNIYVGTATNAWKRAALTSW